MSRSLLVAALVTGGLLAAACERKPAQPAAAPQQENHKRDHEDHDHAHDPASTRTGDGHEHSNAIKLGMASAGPFTLRAARDDGPLSPGGEAAIDVWVSGGDAAVVRLWIGDESARGSIRARAEIESPGSSDHWHAHVEIPQSLLPDGRLWVEIETPDGARHVASFELQR
jgi:ABC-type Zn2+ transport system substrate-binding protein/surface adhesin